MGAILVLEDEESVNRGISLSLEKNGHKVVSCYTIEEAKRLTKSINPELVICDINIPDGSGLDYVRWLRGHRKVYIICLTALDQEMDQVMGYEAGADDYVTKPFSLSVLLLKIEAYFKRNTETLEKDIKQSGDICIKPKEMKVNIHDKDIELTKNEWKLLNFFLKHPKQILSKTQILENVFDIEGRIRR